MYAIIGAMDEEVLAIRSRMEAVYSEQKGPVTFYRGTLNQKEIVLLKSGIALSMAAMSTSICLMSYPIQGIINVGTAGGLADNIEILDQVIGTMVTYHDLDISIFGNPREFSEANRFVFKADEKLLRIAQTLIKDHVKSGPIVSGQQFISDAKHVKDIQCHYPQALCVEMEAASIAHVASEFNIPFIILRSISDHVLHPENHLDFNEYLIKASERSAQLCFDFMGKV